MDTHRALEYPSLFKRPKKAAARPRARPLAAGKKLSLVARTRALNVSDTISARISFTAPLPRFLSATFELLAESNCRQLCRATRSRRRRMATNSQASVKKVITCSARVPRLASNSLRNRSSSGDFSRKVSACKCAPLLCSLKAQAERSGGQSCRPVPAFESIALERQNKRQLFQLGRRVLGLLFRIVNTVDVVATTKAEQEQLAGDRLLENTLSLSLSRTSAENNDNSSLRRNQFTVL